ncbi:MAG: ArnT family glycosyltransferase [Patescibacteria group bacterium]
MKKIVKFLTFPNILLVIILAFAFLVRVYRLDELLGFYYDQGRDALVIWDLWHEGKLFLVGPTTGLAGIFRGPYYYYLIAPFYSLSRGDPIFPTVFLIATSVLAIWFIYHLGSKIQDRETGIFAAILASFSYYLIMAARWLSNPTPMLLLSLVLVWAMLKVTEGRKWGWPIIAVISGLSLFNFGSAGELFYYLAIAVFIIWQWKNRPDLKNLIISILLFGLTFAPLVLFDLRHDGILRNNIIKTFVGEKSFTLPTQFFLEHRTDFYYDVFTNKLFHWRGKVEIIVLLVLLSALIYHSSALFKNKGVRLLFLLLISPMLGLYFYQGNYTVLYDYYLTGYYLVFLLLVAVVLGKIWKSFIGKALVFYFFYLFFLNNYEPLNLKLSDGLTGPYSVGFRNQKEAIDFIYKDAEGEPFNVDVYVPPVIPYAYDYLFKWYGGGKYGFTPENERVALLYTLYEADPSHPERLEAWLARQKGIGKVLKEERFGGITVERRTRIPEKR